MKYHKSVLFILLSLSFGLTPCNADSIWAKRGKNVKQIYADDVARQIGDVLTIRISEESTIDNKANRDLKKTTNRVAEFDGELDITVQDVELLPRIPSLNMEARTSRELKGKADYKDERLFEDFVTVVVIDVLPNKNLVVRGVRDRDIAGDTQCIEITGIVKPSDIAFNNTVDSRRVADFRIINKNGGIAEPYMRPGWLGRIMDILAPF